MTLFSSLVRLLTHLSARRRWQLFALILLMLIGTLAEMATLGAVVPFLAVLADPKVLAKYPILDGVARELGSSRGGLLGAALVFAAAAVAAAVLRILLMWFSLRYSFGLGADIACQVYRRTLYQPYGWHIARNSSEVIAAIDKVNVVVIGVLTPLVQGFVALVLSIGILAMLLWVDARIALIAGSGFAILYGITSVLLRGRLVHNSKVIAANAAERIQAVQEGLGGIRDVLLEGSQEIFVKRFAELDYAMRRAQAGNHQIAAVPRFVVESTGMVLIVALASWLSQGEAGLAGAIPVLGALAVGAQRLLPQIQLAYSSWSSFRGSSHTLWDVLEMLDQPMPKESAPSPAAETVFRSRLPDVGQPPLLRFENVVFKYGPDASPVINIEQLDIPRGTRVGIIGETGGGKSTLIDLMLGLLDPTQGRIFVDGDELVDANRRSWQRRIAHVPQAIYLSDAGIADNIAFAVRSGLVDGDRIRWAANVAQIAGFIESLPEKYATKTGERGVRMSGGQRQRIGLARALYKTADVLVLDEATSALDNTTEQLVMAAIEALGRDVTVIMVAHRLTTLRCCDLIVELNAGRVSRSGSYEDLIGQDNDLERSLAEGSESVST